jgi:hypothetical protein
MTRRLTVTWPDRGPFDRRDGAAIRLLAVSDDIDPALEYAVNREAIGAIDSILGCGDLEPSYLAFLADAFAAPIAYVRGNHDLGGHWERDTSAPDPLKSGDPVEVEGITLVPFEWPGIGHGPVRRNETRAWLDVFRAERHLVRRGLGLRSKPIMVVSHAPPRGVGDVAADSYHRGYAGYRWFLDRRRPPVWLHGHTTPASVSQWHESCGPSTVANVTGAILIELVPPEVSLP